jgi:hypothetical protein
MIHTIDNFLSIDDWERCLKYFKGGNWCFPPLDGKTNKTSVWRIFDPTIESIIGSILYDKLKTLDIPPFAVKRVGINGATTNNESHIHVDGPLGDWSLIWFATPNWQSNWDGDLQIFKDEECWKTPEITKSPNVTKGLTQVEYIPNRAVLFPAHLAHIPVTPNINAKNNLRLSVGLHLKPTDKWNYIYIPRNSDG